MFPQSRYSRRGHHFVLRPKTGGPVEMEPENFTPCGGHRSSTSPSECLNAGFTGAMQCCRSLSDFSADHFSGLKMNFSFAVSFPLKFCLACAWSYPGRFGAASASATRIRVAVAGRQSANRGPNHDKRPSGGQLVSPVRNTAEASCQILNPPPPQMGGGGG